MQKSDVIKAHVFIDETGTLKNPRGNDWYGFGFAWATAEYLNEIETTLMNANLWNIHLSAVNGDDRKIEIAREVGALNLHELGLTGGSVIRIKPDYAYNFISNEVFKNIAENPKVALACLKQKSKKKINAKIIVTPSNIFPKIFDSSRLSEFVISAVRYPLLQILQKYQNPTGLEISYYFSSIGEIHRYKKELNFGTGLDLKLSRSKQPV